MDMSFRMTHGSNEVTFSCEGSKLTLAYGPAPDYELLDIREMTSNRMAMATLLSYTEDHVNDHWVVVEVTASKASE